MKQRIVEQETRTIDLYENGDRRQVRYTGPYREHYEPIPRDESDLTSYTELRIGVVSDSTKGRACVFRQAVHNRKAPRPTEINFKVEEMDSTITIRDCFSFDRGYTSIDKAGIEHGCPVCIEEIEERDLKAQAAGGKSTKERAAARAKEIQTEYMRLKTDPKSQTNRKWLVWATSENLKTHDGQLRPGYGIRTVETATRGL